MLVLNFLCISFSRSINICLKFSGANLFLPCSFRFEYQPTTSINVAICIACNFLRLYFTEKLKNNINDRNNILEHTPSIGLLFKMVKKGPISAKTHIGRFNLKNVWKQNKTKGYLKPKMYILLCQRRQHDFINVKPKHL